MRRTNLALALLALLLTCSASAGTIDDFSTVQALTSSNTFVDGGGIVLGEREFLSIGGETSFSAGAGVGTMSPSGSASFPVARGQLVYDGDDNDSLIAYPGGFDLTDGGASDRFLIDVAGLSGTIDLSVLIYDDATNYVLYSTAISSSGVKEILFTPPAGIFGTGASPATPGAVSFWFDFSNDDEWIKLNSLATGAGRKLPPPEIPEPSTITLVGLGLGLAGFLRFRKNRSART